MKKKHYPDTMDLVNMSAKTITFFLNLTFTSIFFLILR